MAWNGDPFSDPMGLGPLAGTKPPLPMAPAPQVKQPTPKAPTPKSQSKVAPEEALKQNLASRGLSFRPDVGIYSMEEEEGGKPIMVSPLGYAYLEDGDERAIAGKGWYPMDSEGTLGEKPVPSPISAPAKLVAMPDGSATMQIGEAIYKNSKQAPRGAGLYTPFGKLGDKREAVYRKAAHAAKAVGEVVEGMGDFVLSTVKGAAGAEADYLKTLKDLAIGKTKFQDLPGALANSKVGELALGAASRAQAAVGGNLLRGTLAEREANDAQALLDDFEAQAPQDATQMPMSYLQHLASGADQSEDALKRRQAGAVESTVLSSHAKVAKEILDTLGVQPNVRQAEAGAPAGINLHDVRLFVKAKQRLAAYRMDGNPAVTLKNAFADEKLEDLIDDHDDVLRVAHALPKRDKADLARDPEFMGLQVELEALKARAAKIPDKDKAALDSAWKQGQDIAYRLNRLVVKPENRKQFDSAFSKWGEAGRLKAEINKWLPLATDRNAIVKDYEQVLQSDAGRAGAFAYDVGTMLLGSATMGVKGALSRLGSGWLGTTGKALAQGVAFTAPSMPEQIKGSVQRADDGKVAATVLGDLALRAGLDTVMFSEKLAKLGIPGNTVTRILANRATRATGLSVLSSLAESLKTGQPVDAKVLGETMANFFTWEGKAAKREIDMIPARDRLLSIYDSPESARAGIDLARTQRTREFAQTALQLGADPEGKDAPLLRTKLQDLQGLLVKGMEDEAALQSMDHMPGKPKFRGPTSIVAQGKEAAGNVPASGAKKPPIPGKTPAPAGPEAVKESAPGKPASGAAPQAPIQGTEGMKKGDGLAPGVVEKIDRLTQITEDKAETIKRLEDPNISDEEFASGLAEIEESLPPGIGCALQNGKLAFYNQKKGPASMIDLDAAKAAATQAKQVVQGQPEPAAAPEPPVERRVDSERRKLVEEMTPEERANELLTSPVMAGLPNARAFQEQMQGQPRKHVAFLDLDNFKDINDLLGHKAGDKILGGIGLDLQALRNGHNDGRPEEEVVHPFHLSGDEVVVTSDNPESLREFMESYRESISKKRIRVQDASGKWHRINHPGVSYGIGESQEAAEVAAQADKQARRDAGLRHSRGERPVAVPSAEPGLQGSGGRRAVLPEPEAEYASRPKEVGRPRLADIKVEDEEVVPEEMAAFSVPAREKPAEASDMDQIRTPEDLNRIMSQQLKDIERASQEGRESRPEPRPREAEGGVTKGGFYEALRDLRGLIQGGHARMTEVLKVSPGKRGKAFYDRQRHLDDLDQIHDDMRTVYPKLTQDEQAEMRRFFPRVEGMAKALATGADISVEAWNKFSAEVGKLGNKPSGKNPEEAPLTLSQQATKIRTEREIEANPDLPDAGYTIHEGERATQADRLKMNPQARRMLVAHELGASLLHGQKILDGLDAQIERTRKLIDTVAHNSSPGRWLPPESRAKAVDKGENLTGLMPASNVTKDQSAFINEAYGTEHRLTRTRRELVRHLDAIRGIFGPNAGWMSRVDDIVKGWDAYVKTNNGGKTMGGMELDWAPNAKGEAVPLPYKSEFSKWDPATGGRVPESTYQGGTRRHPETGAPLPGNYYSEDGWALGLQGYLEDVAAKHPREDNPLTLNDIFSVVDPGSKKAIQPVPEVNGHPDKVVRLEDRPDPEGKTRAMPAPGGFLEGHGATPADREADASRQLDAIQAVVDESAKQPALRSAFDEDTLKGATVGNLRIAWMPKEAIDPKTGERIEQDSVLGRLLKAGYVVIPGARNELPRTQDRILQIPKGAKVIFERDLATILGTAADPDVMLPPALIEKVRRPGDYQDLESDVRQVTAKDVNRMNTSEEDLDAILQDVQTKGFVRRVFQARASDAEMLKKRRVEMVKELAKNGILTPADFMDSARSLERLDNMLDQHLVGLTPDVRDEVYAELDKLMKDPEFSIRPTAKAIWTRDMVALVEQAMRQKGAAAANRFAKKVDKFFASEDGKALPSEDLGAKLFELSGLKPEDLGVKSFYYKKGKLVVPKLPGRIPAGTAAPKDEPERPFYTVRDGRMIAIHPGRPSEVPAEGFDLDVEAGGRLPKPPIPSRLVEPTDRNRWSEPAAPGLVNLTARKEAGWKLEPFSSVRGSDLPRALRLMVAKKMAGTAVDNVLWRHQQDGRPLPDSDKVALEKVAKMTTLNQGEEFLDSLYQRTGTPYGQPIRMMTKGGWAETVDPQLQEALLREGHPRFEEAMTKVMESVHDVSPREQARAEVAELPDDSAEAGHVSEGETGETKAAQANQEAGESSGNRSVRFSLEDYNGEVTDLTPDMEGLRELVQVNREHLINLSPDKRFTMSDLNGVVLEQARTLWRHIFQADEEGLAKRVWLAVNEVEDPERVSRYRHKVDQIVSAVDLISKPEEAMRFLQSGGILSPALKKENERLVDFVKDNRKMFVDLVNNLDPRLVEQFKLNTHPYKGRGVMGVMNFARDLVKVYGNWKNAFDQIRNESAMGKLGQRIKAMGVLPKEIGYQMVRNARAEASVRTVKVAVHETFHFLERHLDPEIQDVIIQAHNEARDAFYRDPKNAGLALMFGPHGMASDLLGGRSLVDVDDYAGGNLRKFLVEHKEELERNGYELTGNTLYFDGKETIAWAKDGSARIVAPGDAYRFASPSEFFAETAADILTGASRMGDEGNLTGRISEYTSGVHSRLVNFLGSAGDLIGSFGFKTLHGMKPEHLALIRDQIQDAIGSSEHYSPSATDPLQKIAMDRAKAEAEDAWADHVQSRDRLFRIAEASRPEEEGWLHDYTLDSRGFPKKRGNWRLVRKGMQEGPAKALGKLVQATCSADSMSDETLALSQQVNPTVLRGMAHLQADAYYLEGNFSSDPGGRCKSVLDESVLKEHNGQIARMLAPQVEITWNKRKLEGYTREDTPGVVRLEIPAPGEKSGKMGYLVQYDPGTGKIVNYMSDRSAQMWHYLETDGQVSGDLLRPKEIRALDFARGYLREANAQLWEELGNQPGVDRRALAELQKMNPGIWVMRRYTLNGERPSDLHYQTLGMDFMPEAIDEIQSFSQQPGRTPKDVLKEALHRTGTNPTATSLQGPAKEASRVKARSFMTLQEAMQHGYLSKFRNPIEAAIEGRRQLANLILFRETVGHAEDMRLAVLASKGNKLNRETWVEYPLGGSKLTNRLLGFDYKRALLTPEEFADLSEGAIAPPDVRLYVHASAIPLMNSVFGKGYSSQGWYRALADLNAHLNPIQLLGLFHLGTTAGILNASSKLSTRTADLVRSFYAQSRADGLPPKDAYKAAWQHMKATRDAGNLWDGGKSMQRLLIDHAFETPTQILKHEHLSDVQKAFILMSQVGGLNSMRNPLSEKQAAFSKAHALAKKTDYDRTMDFLNNGIQNVKAGVFSLEAVMQKFQSGMMGGIIAPVKLGFAADNFGRFVARNYDITKDGWLADLQRDLATPGSKATKFALEVGDRADDIFGMSNIRKLYMDPRAKDLVTLLTRAFTWHKGNNRLLLKAMDEALSTIPGVRPAYGKVKGMFGGHLIDKDAPRMGANFVVAHTATTLAMNALIFGLLYKAGLSGFAWSDDREDASGVRKAMLTLKDLAFPIQADTHGESFRRFDGSQRRMHSGYLKEWSDLVLSPAEGVKGLIVKGRSPVYELGKAVTLAALGKEKYPDLPYGNPGELQLMPQTSKDYLQETIDEGENGTTMDAVQAAVARMLVEVYNAPTPMTAGTLEKVLLRHSDGGETVPAITKALYLLGMRDVPMESNEEEE